MPLTCMVVAGILPASLCCSVQCFSALDSTQPGTDSSRRKRNRFLSMLACTVIPAGRFAETVGVPRCHLLACRGYLPASLCCSVQCFSALDSTQPGTDSSRRKRNRFLNMLACTVIPAGRFAETVGVQRCLWLAWLVEGILPASLCCSVQCVSALDSTQPGTDSSRRKRNRFFSMLACTVIPAGRFAETVGVPRCH